MQVLNITVSYPHMRNIVARSQKATAEPVRHLSGAHLPVQGGAVIEKGK
jgi:hypothetical protein